MTIKEFSDKYNLPYKSVFNVTYGMEYTTNRMGSHEYNERELINNVLKKLQLRKEKAQKTVSEMDRLIVGVIKVENETGKL